MTGTLCALTHARPLVSSPGHVTQDFLVRVWSGQWVNCVFCGIERAPLCMHPQWRPGIFFLRDPTQLCWRRWALRAWDEHGAQSTLRSEQAAVLAGLCLCSGCQRGCRCLLSSPTLPSLSWDFFFFFFFGLVEGGWGSCPHVTGQSSGNVVNLEETSSSGRILVLCTSFIEL